jgi:hypothetical protein
MAKPEKAEAVTWVSPSTHRLLKQLAAYQGERMGEVVARLVEQEAERVGLNLARLLGQGARAGQSMEEGGGPSAGASGMITFPTTPSVWPHRPHPS